MNVEDKKVKKFDFIHNSFTESAMTQLTLFDQNAKNLINAIRIELILCERLEKNEFETELTGESLTRAKQFLYLDALAKIMMLVEGVLALSDAISDPAQSYSGIAKAMTDYRLNLKFIERFKAKQVDLRKLAGLPELKKLPISEKEREELKPAFDETVKIFEKMFEGIIHFYECNKIPYNKFKHGLSLIPGMQLKNPQEETVAPVILALDTRDKPPYGTSFEMKRSLDPPGTHWFNTLCFVPPPKQGNYDLIINSLLSAISFLTSNHLYYAVNCGEDYFPLKQNPDGRYTPYLLLPKDSLYLKEEGQKRLGPIIDKITQNMNIPKMTFNFSWDLSNEIIAKVLNDFQDHGSAIIWSSETEPASAKVTLTY